jgi:hypothetical protein
MAGITYLYGLWNMNMLGESTMVSSLNDAMSDIQACLSTLAALSGELRNHLTPGIFTDHHIMTHT